MKDSEVVVLELLRKFSLFNDKEWSLLEKEVVARGGVLSTVGTVRQELEHCVAKAARAGVLKHPGHSNQAGHGNGGKNSKGPTGSSDGLNDSGDMNAADGREAVLAVVDNAQSELSDVDTEDLSPGDQKILGQAQGHLDSAARDMDEVDIGGKRINNAYFERAESSMFDASDVLSNADSSALSSIGRSLDMAVSTMDSIDGIS